MAAMNEQEPSLYDIFAGVRVLQSQQTEINRRLGIIEKRQEQLHVDQKTLEELEERIEGLSAGGDKWRDWFWQAVMWVVGVTVAGAVAAYFGLEVRS